MNKKNYMSTENKELLSQLGQELYKARNNSGLSRKKAAEKLNISEHTLYSYEKGRREFDIGIGLRMKELYQITFEKLTNYKELAKTMN